MVAPRWDLLVVAVAVVGAAVVSALHFTAMPHAVRFAYHSPASLGVLVSQCLSIPLRPFGSAVALLCLCVHLPG